MDKKKLIEEIVIHLAQELKVLLDAAEASHKAATSEENKAENQYDTRAIEAGYLAGAQAKRAAELQKQIQIFKYLPVRNYGEDDVMCAGAIAELEHNKTKTYCFMVPQGGGMVLRFEDKPVQIITSISPMGEALLGKKTGEIAEVETRTGVREYKVLAIR